ncbi:MAG: hypothetical protein A3D92_21210 [Bacteroidetes bacterium RIFCSPHIGHO2_02_FULL_44_7]|nr:MAG: hypothetical protein A3D92_21210 [Bacteroidetes bacterium RIFCSPHIGHO2_02_FULL_44_7]
MKANEALDRFLPAVYPSAREAGPRRTPTISIHIQFRIRHTTSWKNLKRGEAGTDGLNLLTLDTEDGKRKDVKTYATAKEVPEGSAETLT